MKINNKRMPIPLHIGIVIVIVAGTLIDVVTVTAIRIPSININPIITKILNKTLSV